MSPFAYSIYKRAFLFPLTSIYIWRTEEVHGGTSAANVMEELSPVSLWRGLLPYIMFLNEL
jgi:hypothetical protein